MSVGTLPDGSDEYSIPEEADELVVEIKARANRFSEIKRLFALRRIVNEIVEDDPDGLLNTEIALADVWPPIVVVRLWWTNLETLEAWRKEASPNEWIWGAFHEGTWHTAFKWQVYTIGKPTASPYSPPRDHEWQQETWKQTTGKMASFPSYSARFARSVEHGASALEVQTNDPVAEKIGNTRLWALLTEPDVLGLSPFQWICALYPAFFWTLFAPDFGIALLPTAIGTVLLAAFFYAVCRRATAKERLRELSDPAKFSGEDGL